MQASPRFGDVSGNSQEKLANMIKPQVDPLVTSGAQKLQAANQPDVLKPLVTTNYVKPVTTSVGKPTLQDFISEAQKLGVQSFQNQADILGQNNEQLVKDLSRGLYSQNIGAASGVGQQVLQNVAKERTAQLAPYAQQTATQTALKTLEYQQNEAQQDQARQDNAFNLILSGQLDKSQFSPTDWAKYGITDPTAIKTVQDMDISNAMTSQGLDPNNPADVENYRTTLRGAAKNNLRQQIIGWYSAANDGVIPTPDEVNMMMMYYGQGTGLLSNEEQTALVNQYNDKTWNNKMSRARDKAKADGKKIICTELHRQGYLSDATYEADQAFGRSLDNDTLIGYTLWAQPVVNLMKKSKIVTIVIAKIASPWAQEMEHVMTGRGKSNLIGKVMMIFGLKVCNILGRSLAHGNSRRIIRAEA